MLGRNVNISIATFQFVAYAMACITMFGFWSGLKSPVMPDYVHGHVQRWTAKFPMWGPVILFVAFLSLVSAFLLWRLKRLGAYLGTTSFMIGFVTNLVVARSLFVHAFFGILLGWILLVPLAIGWKSMDTFFSNL